MFFAISLHMNAQTSEKEYMQWFDSKVGLENTSLYNGFLNDGDGDVERNKSYKGTQRYFKSFEFSDGDLVYEEQPYFNIQMKYDMYEDELLLNLKSSRNTILSIRPIKDKVKSFKIRGKEFVNTNTYSVEDNADIDGFAEILFDGGSFQLLKKHQKNRIDHMNIDGILYEYVEKSIEFLYYKGNFYRVKKQADFAKVFPEFKKEIKKYKIKKNTSEANMLSLSERLQSLISTKSKVLDED